MIKSIQEEAVCVMIKHALNRMSELNTADRVAIHEEYKDILMGLEKKNTNYEVLYLSYLGNNTIEEDRVNFQ